MKSNRGFTLIEIIVALAIFAIMAVLSTVGLQTVLRTYEHTDPRNSKLQQVQLALIIIDRDINQAVSRSVTDQDGHRLQSFLAKSEQYFEFTRIGLQNPMALQLRSEMQRVAYRFENGVLYRKTWDHLDRAKDNQSREKPLLTDLLDVSFQYVNTGGTYLSQWPPKFNTIRGQANQKRLVLPLGVVMNLNVKGLGAVQRFIPLAAAAEVRYGAAVKK